MSIQDNNLALPIESARRMPEYHALTARLINTLGDMVEGAALYRAGTRLERDTIAFNLTVMLAEYLIVSPMDDETVAIMPRQNQLNAAYYADYLASRPEYRTSREKLAADWGEQLPELRADQPKSNVTRLPDPTPAAAPAGQEAPLYTDNNSYKGSANMNNRDKSIEEIEADFEYDYADTLTRLETDPASRSLLAKKQFIENEIEKRGGVISYSLGSREVYAQTKLAPDLYHVSVAIPSVPYPNNVLTPYLELLNHVRGLSLESLQAHCDNNELAGNGRETIDLVSIVLQAAKAALAKSKAGQEGGE